MARTGRVHSPGNLLSVPSIHSTTLTKITMDFLSMHRSLPTGLCAMVLLLWVSSFPELVMAQPGQEQEYENLQVLPEDISEDQLRGIMESFTFALGVNCTHCHVREPGQPPRMNFPSDEKPEKETARAMLKMVQAINGEHLQNLPTVEGDALRVTCVTCHHGLSRPQLLENVLAETLTTHGLDSTFAQYDQLREEYYGTFSYDFSEGALVRLAERLVEEEKAADAIGVLERNIEMFPNSAATYLAMSDAYLAQDNREQAIQSLEKAAELQPNNFRVRRRLEELKGQ